MDKKEVELIIFNVNVDGQDAINMKIYKNGTTCRYGVGGLPQIGISGMSFLYNSKYFNPLIEKVPQNILDKPLNYEEETPNGYLEYIIAFYGVSKNGETGEHADWSKSTGVRVKLDKKSSFNHPIMGFLDGLTMDAAELTNDWYFDIIIQTAYNAKSSTLPKETIIAIPKTKDEIKMNIDNYINQMIHSARKWDIKNYVDNKTYEIDGHQYECVVTLTTNSYNFKFSPLDDSDIKSSRWKFW